MGVLLYYSLLFCSISCLSCPSCSVLFVWSVLSNYAARFFVALIFFVFCTCQSYSEELSIYRKIKCHLLIDDADSACQESAVSLQANPHDAPLWNLYIESLAKAEKEQEMIDAWKQYRQLFPSESQDHVLIEAVAWGIISKGSHSSSPQIRLLALLASYFGQDAKGVAIMHRFLKDSNSCLRSASVQLSSTMKDAILKDGVSDLFKKEKVGSVRLELIKALGKMKIYSAKQDLLNILMLKETSDEEKAAAIQSLVFLMEDADRSEMEVLAKNPRAGLRLLACKVIVHCELKRDVDLLISLLKDHSSEVRSAALKALGMLRVTHFNQIPLRTMIKDLNRDPNPTVAIAAAWLTTLLDPSQVRSLFTPWLQHEKSEIRWLASAALASCGKYSLPYLLDAFRVSSDMFIRANLAVALIGQRVATDAACHAIFDLLTQESKRLMWEDKGDFRVLLPSTQKFSEDKSDPEADNYMVRLELFNILGMMQYQQSYEAILDLLQKKRWGVTGIAAALLLTEGDESSIKEVSQLLNHASPNVRIQAALILSLWSREDKAIQVLEHSYFDADREMKEKIIEGIGRIGSTSSIPFLMNRLDESSQTLRIIAAAALLQCLYH